MKVNKNMSDTMSKKSLFLKDKKRSNFKKNALPPITKLQVFTCLPSSQSRSYLPFFLYITCF